MDKEIKTELLNGLQSSSATTKKVAEEFILLSFYSDLLKNLRETVSHSSSGDPASNKGNEVILSINECLLIIAKRINHRLQPYLKCSALSEEVQSSPKTEEEQSVENALKVILSSLLKPTPKEDQPPPQQ